MSKVVNSIREAVEKCDIQNGMTISFHHHLRNGDRVLNMVMAILADMGLKDLTLAASSIFPIHEPLLELIRKGVIRHIDTNYISGPVAHAISEGILDEPVLFRTHGGRPRAMADGSLKVDIAFIAAPTADKEGNINGTDGPSACGSLGYAMPDAQYARHVIAITDHLVDYPLSPVSIDENFVEYVIKVDSIGDPSGIVSGTTMITRDPVGLTIARYAAQVIEKSGFFQNGFSFQTGAGGTSLATAWFLRNMMKEKGIRGSFGLGGITSYMVRFLEEGLFQNLLDVQCFDLGAIQSLRKNAFHQEISAMRYASPFASSSAVDNLDIVILGGTEIDTDFNVNVHTDSNGYIIGGSGGHSDTAAGAKVSIIVAPLFRARLPIIVDKVTTISSPGKTIDVLVTDRGIAVNPLRRDLRERLEKTNLPIRDIHELQQTARKMTGIPDPLNRGEKIVGQVEYRNGEIIDTIRQVL